MLTCPMCKKKLPTLDRTCKTCQTDVSLLVDYVENLQEGLDLAARLTREGELGDAVLAYLAVLEVDPDNATARRQVGLVATAVRQFDQAAPGRRWLKRLQQRSRLQRFLARLREGEAVEWVGNLLWFLLVLVALLIGYALGYYTPRSTGTEGSKPEARQAPGEVRAAEVSGLREIRGREC